MPDESFISLKDFLMFPFINSYYKCMVYDGDTDETLIGLIQIKYLIDDLNSGKYDKVQNEYYVSDLIPSTHWDGVGVYHSNYEIYIRRF